MQLKAFNAGLAIALSLLPLPLLRMLDASNRNCGDGLCGFASGLIILVLLGIGTMVFIARSARQNETPAYLRMIPVAIWVLALLPLFI